MKPTYMHTQFYTHISVPTVYASPYDAPSIFEEDGKVHARPSKKIAGKVYVRTPYAFGDGVYMSVEEVRRLADHLAAAALESATKNQIIEITLEDGTLVEAPVPQSVHSKVVSVRVR